MKRIHPSRCDRTGMPEEHAYEIVLRGRIGRHLLGPFVDDFTVEHDASGVTRLVGGVRDASHLHGLVVFLALMTHDVHEILAGPSASFF